MAVGGKRTAVASNPRRRIVAGARRHFLAHGFRGVTMDDLARELGMSKKTLYAHFTSKEALVEAALLDKFAELEAELEAITSARPPAFLPALHEMLGTLLRHAEEIRPSFVRDVHRGAPDLFRMIETRRSALIRRQFGRVFAEGRREGMIRSDIPAKLAIAILLGLTQAIVNPERIGELGTTPRAAISAVLTVVLEGLLTRTRRAQR